MSLDQIALRGLRVFGYHGVLDSERRDGQEFLIDAVLWLDTTAAAAADDLTLTVDYAGLAGRWRPSWPAPSAAHRDAGPAPGRGGHRRAAGVRGGDHRA